MKVMIDITEEELSLCRHKSSQGVHPAIASLTQKIVTAVDAWTDPTLETIVGVSTLSELSLQKQLIFDPHTKVFLQKPGAYLVFPQQQSVMHSFPIGKNHTGYMVMSLQAWEALSHSPIQQRIKEQY